MAMLPWRQELHLTENPLSDCSVSLFLRAKSEGAFQRLTHLGLEGTRTSALVVAPQKKINEEIHTKIREKFGSIAKYRD